jgi:hypothetical protein
MNRIKTWSLLPLLVLALAACPGTQPTETPDDEGCEHLQEGPAAAVTAASSATGAPAVSNDHKRYDVTLTSGAAGYVSFASSAAGDYIFFLDQAVPFAVQDPAGANVAIESSALTGAKCAEVKGRHVVPLGVGTYRLVLGPSTTVTKVGMVVEEDAAH